MTKTIIKEIIIMLLLCLAIILVLGVLLYDYVPMAKVIPEEVSYVTPENVQQELLNAGGIDESQIILTYQIDSTDLNNYKKVHSYKAGKTNPFSSYEKVAENTTNSSGSTTSGNTSTNGNSTNNNTNTSTNNGNTNTSGGKYFPDKGTK